jgi:hypothetical protein
MGYAAEVVLRLLILKHIRNWSYGVLEREVRAIVAVRLCFHVFACAGTLMDIAKSYNVSHMTISRL